MDENGDTGLKFGQGSSTSFTICMVMFEDFLQAEACNFRFARVGGGSQEWRIWISYAAARIIGPWCKIIDTC
jgi:hypothetical protein